MKLEPVIPREHLAELGKALQAELPADTENMSAELDRVLGQLRDMPEKTYLPVPVWVVGAAVLTGLLVVTTLGLAVLLAVR